MEQARVAIDRGEPARGRELMEQAAATGHPEAINGWATYLNLGIGGEPEPERAREIYEEAAEKGSVGARLNLALSGIASDDAPEQQRALTWLNELYANPPENQGRETVRALAAGGIGKTYVFGMGLPADLARGVELLEEADAYGGAAGDVLYLLGRAYEDGWGGRTPDSAKSVDYFRRSAELGIPAAQWRLGMALLDEGGEQNETEAFGWVLQAAQTGDTQAEISTAVMYALGQGVEEDDAEARAWYERATRKNSAHALRGLAGMLLQGEGGARNPARGLAYLRLAARGGDEDASRMLDAFESRVDAEDRMGAGKIVDQWLAEHGMPEGE